MGDSIYKQLETLRNSYRTKYTIFNSDGTRENDDYYHASLQPLDHDITKIGITLKEAARSYSRSVDFDDLSMLLKLGLVFNSKFVDDEGNLTHDAVPLEGIVHYSIANVNSYLYGQKNNPDNYADYGMYTYSGYITYDDLVKSCEEQGLSFHGPENFEDFKRRVMNGQKFPTTICASFGLEKEMKLTL